MNTTNEETKLKVKQDLIKKLDRLLLATDELRSQIEEIGSILEVVGLASSTGVIQSHSPFFDAYAKEKVAIDAALVVATQEAASKVSMKEAFSIIGLSSSRKSCHNEDKPKETFVSSSSSFSPARKLLNMVLLPIVSIWAGPRVTVVASLAMRGTVSAGGLAAIRQIKEGESLSIRRLTSSRS